MKESFDFYRGAFECGMDPMIGEKGHRHHLDICKPKSSNRTFRLYRIIVSIRTKKQTNEWLNAHFCELYGSIQSQHHRRYHRLQPSIEDIHLITIIKLNAIFLYFFIKKSHYFLEFYRYLLTLLRNYNRSKLSMLRQDNEEMNYVLSILIVLRWTTWRGAIWECSLSC